MAWLYFCSFHFVAVLLVLNVINSVVAELYAAEAEGAGLVSEVPVFDDEGRQRHVVEVWREASANRWRHQLSQQQEQQQHAEGEGGHGPTLVRDATPDAPAGLRQLLHRTGSSSMLLQMAADDGRAAAAAAAAPAEFAPAEQGEAAASGVRRRRASPARMRTPPAMRATAAGPQTRRRAATNVRHGR